MTVYSRHSRAQEVHCEMLGEYATLRSNYLEERGHGLLGASDLELIEVGLSVVALRVRALSCRDVNPDRPILNEKQPFHLVSVGPSLWPANDVLDLLTWELLFLKPYVRVSDDVLVG